MTGYASVQSGTSAAPAEGDAKSPPQRRLGLEIRSVNSRFLDLGFRLSEELRGSEPAIRELKRVSTPGRRVYSSVSDLKPHRQGLGVSIISTPQGVMTDTSAKEKNVGGEVLCQVF